LGSARPLFYVLQGALWAVGGVSFSAGRLLSLGFSAGLVVCTLLSVRALAVRRLETALGVVALGAIPAFAEEAVAGKSDVPSAAAVALVVALAWRERPGRTYPVFVGTAALLAVLTKPTVLLPLGAFMCFLFVRNRRRDAARSPIAVAAGLG